MKKILQSILLYLRIFGLDPVQAILSIRGLPIFLLHYIKLKLQKNKSNFIDEFEFGVLKPCLGDRYTYSGQTRGHYFHQDLLVANRIFINNPQNHIDVGSRVDGFIAHVASFREISVIDIRPHVDTIRNIRFIKADLMKTISSDYVESCDSLSCLHALEHFGLGRYGDPILFDGYRIGFDNLLKMLKPCGKLYLSVPIGPQRIEFNAHRVFSIAHLLDMFATKLNIVTFSFVNDDGDLHENVELTPLRISSNCNCKYGCGIFEMTKL